jgi:PadR family transcriptional regulator PadR
MSIQDQSTQLKKGILELAVIRLISAGAMYGYEIITRLEEFGFEVVQGTLYPLLTRLHKEGLISYTWEESQQGPPRKYYELTEEGKAYLKGFAKEWEKISSSMKKLLSA